MANSSVGILIVKSTSLMISGETGITSTGDCSGPGAIISFVGVVLVK